VFEHNRIHELYKLPEESIIASMTGVHAIIPEWTASGLEKSAYVDLMGIVDWVNINRDLVERAYGYNAIAKILADTPKKTKMYSGVPVIDLPVGLTGTNTGYEYDTNGKLLGFYSHNGGSMYYCNNSNTALVEMITGVGTKRIDDVYGVMSLPVNKQLDYRFYVCQYYDGLPDNRWVDVTGSNMYVITNGKIDWLINPVEYLTLIRSNSKFLAYTVDLDAEDGVLRFSLNQEALRGGSLGNFVMQLPMGELDLWLNGHALIEGLDYHVRFPEIVIVSKRYLKNPLTEFQKVTVRFTGFCKADLSRETLGDYGFVKHGLLSKNNKFDLRDDKVLRIIADGAVHHRDALDFAEDDVSVYGPLGTNGKPYLIRDMVVPLRNNTERDTYTMRSSALVLDKKISDFMSTMHPEPVVTEPNFIDSLYPLYSPFLCNLIYDLKYGRFLDPRIYENLDIQKVRSIVEPYLFLLKYDPTQEVLQPDKNYTIIHPHNLDTVIELDPYHHRLIRFCVKIYMEGKVELSHHLAISTPA
jgi:hypothetical protein